MALSLWTRAKNGMALFRLRPFDTSTEEGRSKERYRRALLATLASAFARAVVLLIGLVSVPLTVGYLGAERFGLWMTVTSLVALVSFADLGIGNGLINAVAAADGRGDREGMARAVSSAFFLLAAVAALLGLGFALIYAAVPWPRVFNVASPQAAAEAGPAVAVFLACFALGLPLGVVQKAQLGAQEGFASNLWQCLGSVLGLVGVLAAIALEAGLPWLVLAMSGGPLVALALNWGAFFGARPWLRPRWSAVSAAEARAVSHIGLLFFVLQVAGAVAYASDNLVIAQLLGPEAVTEYAVPARLFLIAPTLLGMVLNPLWPAYGEAAARGEMAWVHRTLRRSLAAALLVAAPFAVALVALGPQIIRLWVGDQVAPSLPLLLGFGAWTLVSCLGGVVAMLLNGLTVIRFQAVTATLTAAVAIGLKLALAGPAGLPGVIWASAIASICCTLIPSGLYIPRLLAQKER